MAKMSFVKTAEDQLLPIGKLNRAYKALGAGEQVVLDVKAQRNPRYHRLAMSWLMAIYQNQDHWQTFNQMRYELTCRAGYVDCQYVRDDGTVIIKPKSLAFEVMEEDEFHDWHKAVDTVLQEQFGINIEMGFH